MPKPLPGALIVSLLAVSLTACATASPRRAEDVGSAGAAPGPGAAAIRAAPEATAEAGAPTVPPVLETVPETAPETVPETAGERPMPPGGEITLREVNAWSTVVDGTLRALLAVQAALSGFARLF